MKKYLIISGSAVTLCALIVAGILAFSQESNAQDVAPPDSSAKPERRSDARPGDVELEVDNTIVESRSSDAATDDDGPEPPVDGGDDVANDTDQDQHRANGESDNAPDGPEPPDDNGNDVDEVQDRHRPRGEADNAPDGPEIPRADGDPVDEEQDRHRPRGEADNLPEGPQPPDGNGDNVDEEQDRHRPRGEADNLPDGPEPPAGGDSVDNNRGNNHRVRRRHDGTHHPRFERVYVGDDGTYYDRPVRGNVISRRSEPMPDPADIPRAGNK